MDYKGDLRQVISHDPLARGLALIIANQRGPLPGQPVLMGVMRDFARMTDTFKKLKFAVLSYMDISKVWLLAVVSEVATCRHYPQCYRRIVFVFSGHGRYHFISSHDGDIDINEIIAMFQPCVAPLLGNIPKLFFIDACRGHVSMQPVFAPRGGEDVQTKIVPPYGNCLVVYSTMYLYKSFECEEGGIWMKLLSEKLLTLRKSVFDVLVDVNSELSELYQDKAHWKIIQQPTWEGSLNEHVKLLEEAEGNGPDLPPPFGSEEQPANRLELRRLVSLPTILIPRQEALYVPERSHYLEEGPPNLRAHNCWGSHKSYSADYEGALDKTALNLQHPAIVKQLSEPTGGVASGDGSLEYALSALAVTQNESVLQQYQREGKIQSFKYFSTPIEPTDTGNTHQVVITVTLYENTIFECTGKGPSELSARLRAEEKVIQVIQTREKFAGKQSLGNGTSDSSPLSHEAFTAPVRNYRQIFNEWCQQRGLKPSKEFNCKHTSNQVTHQCTMECTICGQTVYFVSAYHFKKKLAEEEAAKRALEHDALRRQFDLTFPSGKPPVKVLQEYCEKIHGDQLHNPHYATTSSLQRFQSTVTVEGIEKPVYGDVFGTVAEAKHSAALRALHKLEVITITL